MGGFAHWLNTSRILVGREFATQEEVLRALAATFTAEEVHPAYAEGLLLREQNYPTGLPTEPVGLALPHADGRYVKVSGLAVSTLRRPVVFREMGNPEGEVWARVVILIAVSEERPNDQVAVLEWLMGLIQEPGFLAELAAAGTPEEVMRRFGMT
ncbi:MAG: PTS sugar transporter subunit IIA [Thermaerobacter sp.]|nr:PTS sugar transporter subunit IIA [Thermaerobacter sp.]